MAFKDPYGAHRTAGVPLIGVTWSDVQFDHDDVAGVIFKDCVFERVRLTATSLWQTMFVNCRLDDCEFVDCRVFRTQWVECSGSGFRISGGELSEAVFSSNKLETLTLEQAGLRLVFGENEFGRVAFNSDGCAQDAITISGCSFESVVAENAVWRGGAAVGVDLRTWSLEGAHFEQCAFVQAIGDGVDFSPVRFERCNLYRAGFREARIRSARGSIFTECHCEGADFVEADLDGALFAKALAGEARFCGARLDNAMFPGATLVGADFSGAQARQSVWTGADLTGANLERLDAYRATFRNAVLKDAQVLNARFVEADLHGVKEMLESADLRDSRGTIPWRAEREEQARSGFKSNE
jgi:uncharacterized protein YjbI with pentapeptide repeats